MEGAVMVKVNRPERRVERPKIDWYDEALKMYESDFTSAARMRLSRELGVSNHSLVELRVGFGEDVGGEFTSWPERSPNMNITGIIRRYWDGTKKMMHWGRHGLYIPRVPSLFDDSPILLCEGGSDTAALASVHICAVGRPSNIGGVDYLTRLLRPHRHRKIIVLGERDEKPERRGQPKTAHACPTECNGCSLCWPGLWGAKETARRLSDAGIKAQAMLPPTKDAREWVKREGKFTSDAGAKFLSQLEKI
jgi:hypothetical protein